MGDLVGVAQVELREPVGRADDVPQRTPGSGVGRRRADGSFGATGDLHDPREGTVGVGHALRQSHGIRPLDAGQLLELAQRRIGFRETREADTGQSGERRRSIARDHHGRVRAPRGCSAARRG